MKWDRDQIINFTKSCFCAKHTALTKKGQVRNNQTGTHNYIDLVPVSFTLLYGLLIKQVSSIQIQFRVLF